MMSQVHHSHSQTTNSVRRRTHGRLAAFYYPVGGTELPAGLFPLGNRKAHWRMLILSRRPGESIVIGGTITVEVLEVRGSTVRLGFTAPETIAIHRKELVPRLGERTQIRSRAQHEPDVVPMLRVA